MRYGITRLHLEVGTPRRVLQLRRCQWLIENRRHRTKEVNFGENACLIHVNHGSKIVALLRDASFNLTRQAGPPGLPPPCGTALSVPMPRSLWSLDSLLLAHGP